MSHIGALTAIIGESAAVEALRREIARVAPTRLAVLIQGETGSGKELVAEALHVASGRQGPLVAFNVCAVTETMFEATLFGHLRGAFTGAVTDMPGYVAQAHGGTLFLDEISGLPLSMQSKLLRVVETQSYRPIGARSDRRSDFRIVAATNEDIMALVRDGRIRRDLGHRLGAAVLDVPPLRWRLDDVPALAAHFAARASTGGRERCVLSESAVRRLLRYRWPGNVRELRNVVELAVALSESPIVEADTIEQILSRGSVFEPEANRTRSSQRDARKTALLDALDRFGGDTAMIAAQFGVDRRTIYRWMEELGIPTPKRMVRRRLPTPR